MTIEIQITTTEVGTTEEVTTLVEVAGAGPQGAQGAQGPTGPGVPDGGTTGQVLVKVSGTDQDTEWTDDLTVDSVTFDIAAGLEAESEGELVWDTDAGTIDLGMNDGVTQRVGEDLFYRVQAVEAVSKGDLLMSVGTAGNSGLILAAKSTPTYNGQSVGSQNLMGLAAANIAQGERGYAIAFGRLRKFDTTDFEEGDILWADPANAGGLTVTRPEAPNWKTIIALVVTKSEQVGSLQIRPTFGSSLANDELAHINGVSDNDILRYNQATGRFETEALNASGTEVDASGFSGLLSATDTTVQLALSTLDGVSLADLGITATDIANWNTAYGWGDHSAAGYLTSYTGTDPVFTASPAGGITGTQIGNWDTAYSWGDHSTAGYLTSYTETDTLDSVTGRGATTSNNIRLNDNAQLQFGSGNDLQIYHNGSSSFIQDTGTGDLILRSSNYLYLQSYTGAENYLIAGTNGGVWLYYDNLKKLETASTGVDVIGVITATGGNSTNWNTAYGWGDHALAGYATSQVFTATVTGSNATSDWTGSDPYVATIAVSGILSTDTPIFDIDLSGVAFANVFSVEDDWALVYRAEASADNEIKLYATNEPFNDFDLIIRVNR